MKIKALKEQDKAAKSVKALTVYPPNTPVKLVPRVLPTKSQVKINIFSLIQLFLEFKKTREKRITPTGLTEGEKEFEQTKECYLTEVLRLSDPQLTEKVSVFQEQNELFMVENAKVKQHYKELYDSIKITRAKHIDQTTSLLTKNENLKVQINAKLKCVTIDSVTPKVLAPGMYAIDVEPIPSHLRNNREVHLDYLKHLKESVATLREMVKEAKVERPLDRSVASACLYTKHSHELLEYVIGTCQKDFNK
nr:integrase, catalytic region, zinc finger, CCHC-type, peptidase aspartic, catalytic [Tanacetum cinerariifolium]